MPDPEEIKYEKWAKLAELVRKEQIGVEEGARQLIELDPDAALGYGLLASVRIDEGRTEEAVSLFWKTVDLEPCQSSGYCALANLVNQNNDNVALAARLSWIAVAHLMAADELPAESVEFLTKQFHRPAAELKDPSVLKTMWSNLDRELRDEPPGIRERLLPLMLLAQLRHEFPVSFELLRDVLMNPERCEPVWRAALQEWKHRNSSLKMQTVGMLIAMLGEISGPDVLPDLFKVSLFPDELVFPHTQWALWRLGQRFPEEVAEAIRKATPDAIPMLRCCLADHLAILPKHCEIVEAVTALFEGFTRFSSDENAGYLLAAAMYALELHGHESHRKLVFHRYEPLLSGKARSWMASCGDSFLPRLAVMGNMEFDIESVCLRNALAPAEDDQVGMDEVEDRLQSRDVFYDEEPPKPVAAAPKPGRNDSCWCGSGKKYKKCHLEEDERKARLGEYAE